MATVPYAATRSRIQGNTELRLEWSRWLALAEGWTLCAFYAMCGRRKAVGKGRESEKCSFFYSELPTPSATATDLMDVTTVIVNVVVAVCKPCLQQHP